MFNDTIIVQTAISTFNNAALFSPMFFWTGLLMLPLFFIAYKYGNKFIDYTNIDLLKSAKNKTFNFSFVVLIAIFAWLAFVGGNYIVLRDETSILPFVIAGLFFIMSASIIHKLRMINPDLPSWMQAIKYKKTFLWLSFIACAISVALLSGLDSGLGLLMMFAAVFCGGLLGRALKKASIFPPSLLMTVMGRTAPVLSTRRNPATRSGIKKVNAADRSSVPSPPALITFVKRRAAEEENAASSRHAANRYFIPFLPN